MNELNADVLQRIISALDNTNLEVLRNLGLSEIINDVQKKNAYWHSKTEFLLNRKLEYLEKFNWEKIYDVISRAKKCMHNKKNIKDSARYEKNIFLWCVAKKGNPEALSVLYKSGEKSMPGKNGNILINRIINMKGYVGWLKDGSEYIDQHKDEYETIKIIIEEGKIDPSAFDNQAIIEAARKNYPDVVEYLLNFSKVDASAQNNLAIEGSHNPEIIKMLLMNKRVDPNSRNKKVFMDALSESNEEVIEILLNDSRLDLTTNRDRIYYVAIKYGNEKLVKKMVEQKIDDPILYDNIIMYAAEYDRANIVSMLLSDNRPSILKNYDALIVAEKNGFKDITEILLKDKRINIKEIIDDLLNKGDYISAMSILSDPNINMSGDFPKFPNKNIINSLCGLAAGIYYGNKGNEINVFNKDINPPGVYLYRNRGLEEMYAVCSKIILYIIDEKPSMIDIIREIGYLSKNYRSTQSAIKYAAKTTLTGELYYKDQNLFPLYGAIRGLLLLSYKPQYTYMEIIRKHADEDAPLESKQLAFEFICTYFGITELRKQNMPVSADLWNYASYIYKDYIKLNK